MSDPDKLNISSTLWRTVIDHDAKRYYFDSVINPSVIWVDLDKVDFDSMYLHQMPHFSRLRYREDATWLLQNAGLSIRPMIDIARFIAARINEQMAAVGQMQKEGHVFTHGDLTNRLLISKADVRKKFGQRADAFFAKFTTQPTGTNADFVDPFADQCRRDCTYH